MENVHEINRKIGDNLAQYRKAAGLTQAELAEKINYSDKSVSKWESGNGIPDVYTLIQIARVFGVSLNELVGEEMPTPKAVPPQKRFGLHLLIMLLSSGIVWLVATCIFVVIRLIDPQWSGWLAFIYAVFANAIVLIVYAGVWKYRLLGFVSVSTLVWITLTCIYLTARLICEALGNPYEGLWCLFLLGVPLQILEILWVFFRSLFRKNKEKQALAIVEEKPLDESTEEVQNG